MSNSSQLQNSFLLGWFTTAFLLILTVKLALAALLDLYSDEVFYWWASTRLSLAYSDLPFMTALLAGLGSGFGPADSFSVRILFLILGTSIPGLVYWIARPISNPQMALESALLTLCLPLGGFLGLLAVPDVPLIFLGLLAIGFFQRALCEDKIGCWIGTGIFVALGLSTHYRFFLYPLAAVLFLALFAPERKQWRNSKLWLAMVIASLGLIPITWFNLSNQLSSASFYLVERHPWEFQPSGLLHVFKQAGIVTPPLYCMLLFTLLVLWREAKQGNRNSALLCAFACVNLAVYFVLAPWTDANSTSIHWPLSGYFPLLIAMPVSLRTFHGYCARRWNESRANSYTILIPALGFLGTLIAFIGVGSQAFQTQLQAWVGRGVLSNKMAGWEEFTDYTEQVLRKDFENQQPLLITNNYYTAAQLEFAGISTDTVTFDDDKAVRDGRITQLMLWNKDESGLAAYKNSPALFIVEDSNLILEHKTRLLDKLCLLTEGVEQLESLSLFNGDKAFSFYQVSAINPSNQLTRAFPCPYPMQAWIDFPPANESLSNTVQIAGWAFSEDIGISAVQLMINGNISGIADYGISRPDVVDARHVSNDPNAPNLGFAINFNTSEFANGKYELAIVLRNNAGAEIIYGERTIHISN